MGIRTICLADMGIGMGMRMGLTLMGMGMGRIGKAENHFRTPLLSMYQ